jgi:hypothetical protein
MLGHDHALLPGGLGLGLVVASLAGLFTYAGFGLAADPTTVTADAGDRHELTFADGEPDRQHRFWSTQLVLDGPPEAYEISVGVPYTVDPQEPDVLGADVWTNATVNGENATQHRYRPSTTTVALVVPGPHLDTPSFQEGTNTIAVETTAHRPPEAEGSAQVTIGPLQAEAQPQDTDGDGIVDTDQPVHGLHTAWVAAAGALLAGAPATYLRRRALDDGEEGRG